MFNQQFEICVYGMKFIELKSFTFSKPNLDVTKYTSKSIRQSERSDLSTLTVSPCVTRFHCLSHGLTVGSSFLTVLQILSGFSLKLTAS